VSVTDVLVVDTLRKRLSAVVPKPKIFAARQSRCGEPRIKPWVLSQHLPGVVVDTSLRAGTKSMIAAVV
jgi:hypothetical protein